MSEIVPFNDANLDREKDVKFSSGLMVRLTGDRSIQVLEVDGGAHDGGICIRIFRPTNDGKLSKLSFALSPDAATALTELLVERRKR